MGAGYVGLSTMAMLLDLGLEVSVLESDENRVNMLTRGASPIDEPGLTDMLRDGLDRGAVRFSAEAALALEGCDVVFVCVGTPEGDDGAADLSAVVSVIDSVERHAPRATTVIKSTVPPGTTASLQIRFNSLKLAVNPEFLRQGSAVADAINPTRVVVGTERPDAHDALKGLYALMADRGTPQVFTTFTSAELIKYASNSFLAVKVAFINEIADLCEATGASVADVKLGMGLDPRIGDRFLQAGPGFGGSCLPKDTAALAHTARHFGTPLSIVEAVITANRQRRASLGDRVIRAADPRDVGAAGVLGLTFKAATDDTRESPAIDLVEGLLAKGISVAAFDPGVRPNGSIPSGASVVSTIYEVFDAADVVAVATEWPEFADLDFAEAAARMSGDTIVDLRGILDRENVERAGLRLVSVGAR